MADFDFSFISNNELPVSSYKDIKAFAELIAPTKKETTSSKKTYEAPLTYRTEDWTIYQLMVNQNIQLTKRNLEIAKALHRYNQLINQLNIEYMAQWMEALKHNSDTATEAVMLLVSRNLEVSQENFDAVQQVMQDQNLVLEIKELSKKIDTLNEYLDKVTEDHDEQVKVTNDDFSDNKLQDKKDSDDNVIEKTFDKKESDEDFISNKITNDKIEEKSLIDKDISKKSIDNNSTEKNQKLEPKENIEVKTNDKNLKEKVVIKDQVEKQVETKSLVEKTSDKKIVENPLLVKEAVKSSDIHKKQINPEIQILNKELEMAVFGIKKENNQKEPIKEFNNKVNENIADQNFKAKDLKPSDFSVKSIIINDEPVIVAATGKIPSFQKIIKLNKLPSEAKVIQNEPVVIFSNGKPQLAIKDTSGLKVLLVNTDVIEKKLGIIRPETFQITQQNNGKVQISFKSKTNNEIVNIQTDNKSVEVVSKDKPKVITFNNVPSLIVQDKKNSSFAIVPITNNVNVTSNTGINNIPTVEPEINSFSIFNLPQDIEDTNISNTISNFTDNVDVPNIITTKDSNSINLPVKSELVNNVLIPKNETTSNIKNPITNIDNTIVKTNTNVITDSNIDSNQVDTDNPITTTSLGSLNKKVSQGKSINIIPEIIPNKFNVPSKTPIVFSDKGNLNLVITDNGKISSFKVDLSKSDDVINLIKPDSSKIVFKDNKPFIEGINKDGKSLSIGIDKTNLVKTNIDFSIPKQVMIEGKPNIIVKDSISNDLKVIPTSFFENKNYQNVVSNKIMPFIDNNIINGNKVDISKINNFSQEANIIKVNLQQQTGTNFEIKQTNNILTINNNIPVISENLLKQQNIIQPQVSNEVKNTSKKDDKVSTKKETISKSETSFSKPTLSSNELINAVLANIPEFNPLESLSLNSYPKEIFEEINKLTEEGSINTEEKISNIVQPEKPLLIKDNKGNLILVAKKDSNFINQNDLDNTNLVKEENNNLSNQFEPKIIEPQKQTKDKKDVFSDVKNDIKSEVENEFNKLTFEIPELFENESSSTIQPNFKSTENTNKINESIKQPEINQNSKENTLVKIPLNSSSNISNETVIFELPFEVKKDIEPTISKPNNNQTLEDTNIELETTNLEQQSPIDKPKAFLIKQNNTIFTALVKPEANNIQALKTSEGNIIFKDISSNQVKSIDISNSSLKNIDKETIVFKPEENSLFIIKPSKNDKNNILKVDVEPIENIDETSTEILPKNIVITDDGEVIFSPSKDNLENISQVISPKNTNGKILSTKVKDNIALESINEQSSNVFSFSPKQLKTFSTSELFKNNNIHFDENSSNFFVKNGNEIVVKKFENEIFDDLIDITDDSENIVPTDNKNLFLVKNKQDNSIRKVSLDDIPPYVKDKSDKNFILNTNDGNKILFFVDDKTKNQKNINLDNKTLSNFDEEIEPIKLEVLGKEKVLFKDNNSIKIVGIDNLAKPNFKQDSTQVFNSQNKPLMVINIDGKNKVIDLQEVLKNLPKMENKFKVTINGQTLIVVPDNVSGNHNIFPEKPSTKINQNINLNNPLKASLNNESVYLIKDLDKSLKALPENMIKENIVDVSNPSIISDQETNNEFLLLNHKNINYKIPFQDKVIKNADILSKPIDLNSKDGNNKLFVPIDNKLFSLKVSDIKSNFLNNQNISGEIGDKEVFVLNENDTSEVINKDTLYKYSTPLKSGNEVNLKGNTLVSVPDKNGDIKLVPKEVLLNKTEEVDEPIIFNTNGKNVVAFKDNKNLKFMQFSNVEKQLKNINDPLLVKSDGKFGVISFDKNNLKFNPISIEKFNHPTKFNEPLVVKQENSFKVFFEDNSKLKTTEIPLNNIKDFNSPIITDKNKLVINDNGIIKTALIEPENIKIDKPIELKLENKSYLLFNQKPDTAELGKSNVKVNIVSVEDLLKSTPDNSFSFSNTKVEPTNYLGVMKQEELKVNNPIITNKNSERNIAESNIKNLDNLTLEKLSQYRKDIEISTESNIIQSIYNSSNNNESENKSSDFSEFVEELINIPEERVSIETGNNKIKMLSESLLNKVLSGDTNNNLKISGIELNSYPKELLEEINKEIDNTDSNIPLPNRIEKVLNNKLKTNDVQVLNLADKDFIVQKDSNNKINFINPEPFKNSTKPKVFEIKETGEKLLFIPDSNNGRLIKLNNNLPANIQNSILNFVANNNLSDKTINQIEQTIQQPELLDNTTILDKNIENTLDKNVSNNIKNNFVNEPKQSIANIESNINQSFEIISIDDIPNLQNNIVPKILESNLSKQIKLETKDLNENVVSDVEQNTSNEDTKPTLTKLVTALVENKGYKTNKPLTLTIDSLINKLLSGDTNNNLKISGVELNSYPKELLEEINKEIDNTDSNIPLPNRIEKVLNNKLKTNDVQVLNLADKDFIVQKDSNNKINFINPETFKNSTKPKIFEIKETGEKLLFIPDSNNGRLIKLNNNLPANIQNSILNFVANNNISNSPITELGQVIQQPELLDNANVLDKNIQNNLEPSLDNINTSTSNTIKNKFVNEPKQSIAKTELNINQSFEIISIDDIPNLQNNIVPKILESNLSKQIKLETKDSNENVVSDVEQNTSNDDTKPTLTKLVIALVENKGYKTNKPLALTIDSLINKVLSGDTNNNLKISGIELNSYPKELLDEINKEIDNADSNIPLPNRIEKVLNNKLKTNDVQVLNLADKDFIVQKDSNNKINFINPETFKNSTKPKVFEIKETGEKLLFIPDSNNGRLIKLNNNLPANIQNSILNFVSNNNNNLSDKPINQIEQNIQQPELFDNNAQNNLEPSLDNINTSPINNVKNNFVNEPKQSIANTELNINQSFEIISIDDIPNLENNIVPKILESNLSKQIKLETKDSNENVVSDIGQNASNEDTKPTLTKLVTALVENKGYKTNKPLDLTIDSLINKVLSGDANNNLKISGIELNSYPKELLEEINKEIDNTDSNILLPNRIEKVLNNKLKTNDVQVLNLADKDFIVQKDSNNKINFINPETFKNSTKPKIFEIKETGEKLLFIPDSNNGRLIKLNNNLPSNVQNSILNFVANNNISSSPINELGQVIQQPELLDNANVLDKNIQNNLEPSLDNINTSTSNNIKNNFVNEPKQSIANAESNINQSFEVVSIDNLVDKENNRINIPTEKINIKSSEYGLKELIEELKINTSSKVAKEILSQVNELTPSIPVENRIEKVLASRLKENEPTIIRINDKDFIVTKSSDNKINFINPDTLKNSKLEPKFLDFEDKKLIFIPDNNGGKLLNANESNIEIFNNPIDIKNENKILISDNKGNLKKVSKDDMKVETIKDTSGIQIIQTLIGNKMIVSDPKLTGKAKLIDINDNKENIVESDSEVFFIENTSNSIKKISKDNSNSKPFAEVINTSRKTSILNSNEGIKVLIRDGNVVPFKLEEDVLPNKSSTDSKFNNDEFIFKDDNGNFLIKNTNDTNLKEVKKESFKGFKPLQDENIFIKKDDKNILLKYNKDNQKAYFTDIPSENLQTLEEPMIASKDGKEYLIVNNNNKLKSIDISNLKNPETSKAFLIQNNSNELLVFTPNNKSNEPNKNLFVNLDNLDNVKTINQKTKVLINNEHFIVFPDNKGEHKVFAENPTNKKDINLNSNTPIKAKLNLEEGYLFKSITNELKFVPEKELNTKVKPFNGSIESKSYKETSVIFENKKGELQSFNISDKAMSKAIDIEKPLELEKEGESILLIPNKEAKTSILKGDFKFNNLNELSDKDIIFGDSNGKKVVISNQNNKPTLINSDDLLLNADNLKEGSEVIVDNKPLVVVNNKNNSILLSNEQINTLKSDKPFSINKVSNELEDINSKDLNKNESNKFIVFKDKGEFKIIDYKSVLSDAKNLDDNISVSTKEGQISILVNNKEKPQILSFNKNEIDKLEDFKTPISDYSNNNLRIVSNENNVLKESKITNETLNNSESVTKFNYFDKTIIKPENSFPISIKNDANQKVTIDKPLKITFKNEKYLVLPSKDNKVLMLPSELLNKSNDFKPDFNHIEKIKAFDLANINDINTLNQLLTKNPPSLEVLQADLVKMNQAIKEFLSMDILKSPEKFAYNISVMKQIFGQFENKINDLKDDFEPLHEKLSSEHESETSILDNEEQANDKNKLKLKMSAETLLNAVLSEVSSRVEKISLNLHGRELLSNNDNCFCIPISIPVAGSIFNAELMVKEETHNKNKRGGKTLAITLAIETKNLDKVILEFINFNEDLQVAIKVDNEKIRKIFEPKLPTLTKLLSKSKYNIKSVTCSVNQNKDRGNSLLLPQNTFPKSLKRIEGII